MGSEFFSHSTGEGLHGAQFPETVKAPIKPPAALKEKAAAQCPGDKHPRYQGDTTRAANPTN